MNNKHLILTGAIAAVVALAVLVLDTHADVSPPQAAATSQPAPAAPAAVPEAGMSAAPQQVIEITAGHGYSPASSVAKAGLPAVIKITATGTFDCSNVVVIPDLNYRARLPTTGSVEIPVPPQPAGKELTGLCGMGMYRFTVRFEG
jgi:hypothetical protein